MIPTPGAFTVKDQHFPKISYLLIAMPARNAQVVPELDELLQYHDPQYMVTDVDLALNLRLVAKEILKE